LRVVQHRQPWLLNCDVGHDAFPWQFHLSVEKPASRRLPDLVDMKAGGIAAACTRTCRGDADLLAAHKAFQLAFGPGQRLLHGFALVEAHAHLGQCGLRVDLLGYLGGAGEAEIDRI